jgi:hypothetical protein
MSLDIDSSASSRTAGSIRRRFQLALKRLRQVLGPVLVDLQIASTGNPEDVMFDHVQALE